MKLPTITPNMLATLRRLAAVAALAALFLLAAGLPRLEFSPGKRYILPQNERQVEASGSLVIDMVDWFDALIIVTAILVALSLVVVLREKDSRKQLWLALRQVLVYGLLIAVVLTLYSNRMQQEARPQVTVTPAAVIEENMQPAEQPAEAAEVAIKPLPGWATYLVSLALVLAVALAGYVIWRKTRPPDSALAEIARQALEDIAAGRDWDDVVIRCYADMSAAASQRRNLQRPGAMTPREFALRLEAAGLPARSIHTLTLLFEKARYGRGRSSNDESQQAMTCLAEILQAVENPA